MPSCVKEVYHVQKTYRSPALRLPPDLRNLAARPIQEHETSVNTPTHNPQAVFQAPVVSSTTQTLLHKLQIS